ncbi:MAG: type IV pilus modification PilV family protein [Bacillota bacterium]
MSFNYFNNNEAGFSFIEIVIAIAILSIAGIVIFSSFSGSMRLFSSSKESEEVLELANYIMSRARSECIESGADLADDNNNGYNNTEDIIIQEFNNQNNGNYSLDKVDISPLNSRGISELIRIEIVIKSNKTDHSTNLKSLAWNGPGNFRKEE